MKKTIAALATCALLGATSIAFAGDTDMKTDTTTGRAAAPESNNEPGTKAGTPVQSVPSNSAGTGLKNETNSGKQSNI